MDEREALRVLVQPILREMLTEALADQRPAPAQVHILDDEARAEIQEQIAIANKTWLTRREAAIYLQVSERSIAEWAVRPVKDNPFPEGSAGSEPRYKRERIDQWAETENTRRRLKLAS